MKQLILLLFSLLGIQVLAQPVQPPVLPELWLQSETIESKQGYWLDAVHGKRKALPDSNKHFPASNWFNYNQSLDLDSVNNSLAITYPVKNLKSLTVIVVYHTTDTTEQGLWQLSNQKEVRAYLSTRRLSSGKAIRHTDSSITIPAIHTYIPTFRKALQDTCKFIIGSTDSLPFKGKIAEFMVYNRILKGAELQKVQTYLAVKYGISLIKTNYISSQETILWDTLSDANYWNSIAGMGRDDAFGLHQKQSFSTTLEDFIRLGANGIQNSNQSNRSELPENHFWLWGHNGKSFQPGTEQTATGGVLAERRWQMRCSGDSSARIPTVLHLDVRNLDSVNQHNCHLVIDRSGTADMNKAEHIKADLIQAKGMLCFSNIYWDTDGSGSDIFTFSLYEPQTKDTSDTPAGKKDKKSVTAGSGQDGDSDDLFQSNKKATVETDNSGKPQYILSPNPTKGPFRLQMNFPEETTATARLLNAQGKMLKEKKMESLSQYVWEDELTASGTYLIEVSSKYETKTLKLVVNK